MAFNNSSGKLTFEHNSSVIGGSFLFCVASPESSPQSCKLRWHFGGSPNSIKSPIKWLFSIRSFSWWLVKTHRIGLLSDTVPKLWVASYNSLPLIFSLRRCRTRYFWSQLLSSQWLRMTHWLLTIYRTPLRFHGAAFLSSLLFLLVCNNPSGQLTFEHSSSVLSGFVLIATLHISSKLQSLVALGNSLNSIKGFAERFFLNSFFFLGANNNS